MIYFVFLLIVLALVLFFNPQWPRIWRWGAFLLGIVLPVGVLLKFYFSGFCFAQVRYLTNEEFCQSFREHLKSKNEDPEALRFCTRDENQLRENIYFTMTLDDNKLSYEMDFSQPTIVFSPCGKYLGDSLDVDRWF